MTTTTPQTLRLSPPQRQALTLLRDGWACQTAGREPARFGALVHYPFHRAEATRSVSGTTLASLQRHGLIAWEAATLTLAYDESQVPGYTLVLTPSGRTVVVETTTVS